MTRLYSMYHLLRARQTKHKTEKGANTMKKLITILTLSFILIMGTSIAANAEEITEEGQRPAVTRQADRESKTLELEAKRDSIEAKRLDQQAKRLEVLSEVAPDWVDAFVDAFDDHNSVHELLEEAAAAWRDFRLSEVQANSELFKADILAQVEDGSLAKEDARALFAEHREEVKAENEAIRAQFQAEVDAIKASLGLSQEAAEALHADFKAAVESEDARAIDEAVSAIYDYLLTHTEFDYLKLDLINSKLTVEL